MAKRTLLIPMVMLLMAAATITQAEARTSAIDPDPNGISGGIGEMSQVAYNAGVMPGIINDYYAAYDRGYRTGYANARGRNYLIAMDERGRIGWMGYTHGYKNGYYDGRNRNCNNVEKYCPWP